MAKGIKWVKKANAWQFYVHEEGGKNPINKEKWFVDKEKAEERLAKEQ